MFTLPLIAGSLGRDEATGELKSRTTKTRAVAFFLFARAFHLGEFYPSESFVT